MPAAPSLLRAVCAIPSPQTASPSLRGGPLRAAALRFRPWKCRAPGDGRAGRALLNLMLMEAGFPPIAFKADRESARRYYDAIAAFVGDVERRDGTALLRLVVELEDQEFGKRLALLG